METKIKTEPLSAVKDTQIQKITPFLWFDTQAMDAANFYASVFKNARVKTSTKYSAEAAAGTGMQQGSVMTVDFELEGQEFTAINGGPVFKINPSISFTVNCRTGEKVNDLWSKLSEGGTVLMELNKYPFSERYGWVQDKFGVSWQLILNEESPIIVPCLLFTGEQKGKAEEAINFYMSLFRMSSVDRVMHYEPGEPGPEGMVKYSSFTINGQKFSAMDIGNEDRHDFSPAVSFVINCDTQEQIDYYWDHLAEGGDPGAQQCGWLADKYGISWQVVPSQIGLWTSDPARSGIVMGELMKMKKLDLNKLKSAFSGGGNEPEGSELDYGSSDYQGKAKDTLSPGDEF
jgi:predicted 3-demethylubiquinone-9 3-methyltransferase (glyoxalase superfamily)